MPPNVIRMPRGPDKGKGFARWCNSRMTPKGAPAAPTAAPAAVASAPTVPQKQQQPLVQRKSRAIPIVAPPAVNNNLVVNLDSSDSDEGHYSDHEQDLYP